MNIAIIGTGNVGGALAKSWAKQGHSIRLGVRDLAQFKGKELLEHAGIQAFPITEAVAKAEVILLATPAPTAASAAQSLGDTTGKIIIDAMNIVMGRGPEGYTNTAEAILANTATREVVKCFNTTGFNNMENPQYGDQLLDMFMAGGSDESKAVVRQLAIEAGFATCYDVGGPEQYGLMEQFALFWINLAMFRGQGRDIGFKLLRR